MGKIKEVSKLGLSKPYVINFSGRLEKFMLVLPKEVEDKKIPYTKCFDLYADCITEIDRIHGEFINEEKFIRKVIYVVATTNYDVNMNNRNEGYQGFNWTWFVLNEYIFNTSLKYNIVEMSRFARQYSRAKIDILPQLLFTYNSNKGTMIDYSDEMLDKIKTLEANLEVSILKIQDFFSTDSVIKNLELVEPIKLLS